MGIHWQKSHNDVFQYFVLLHDNKSVCVHKVMFHCHVSPIGSEKPNTVSSARPFMLTAATVVPPKQDEVNSVFCLSHVYLKQKKKARQDITICGVWRIKGGFSQPEEKMPLCCLVVWLQILLYPLAAAWTGWNQDWTVTQYFLLCCAIKSNLSLASWWNCLHFSAYCQQTGGQPIFRVVLQSRMMGVFLQANRFVNM